jgi:hypothetical protein
MQLTKDTTSYQYDAVRWQKSLVLLYGPNQTIIMSDYLAKLPYRATSRNNYVSSSIFSRKPAETDNDVVEYYLKSPKHEMPRVVD